MHYIKYQRHFVIKNQEAQIECCLLEFRLHHCQKLHSYKLLASWVHGVLKSVCCNAEEIEGLLLLDNFMECYHTQRIWTELYTTRKSSTGIY